MSGVGVRRGALYQWVEGRWEWTGQEEPRRLGDTAQPLERLGQHFTLNQGRGLKDALRWSHLKRLHSGL